MSQRKYRRCIKKREDWLEINGKLSIISLCRRGEKSQRQAKYKVANKQ